MSTALTLLNDEQLIDILNSARKNNIKHNITGVLLYSEGVFIQVIEGDEAGVDLAFAKIEKDFRHKNIITLIDQPIQHKSFADWAMGFATLRPDKVNDLIGYLRSTKELSAKSNSTAAIVTVKTFIDTNNLLIK